MIKFKGIRVFYRHTIHTIANCDVIRALWTKDSSDQKFLLQYMSLFQFCLQTYGLILGFHEEVDDGGGINLLYLFVDYTLDLIICHIIYLLFLEIGLWRRFSHNNFFSPFFKLDQPRRVHVNGCIEVAPFDILYIILNRNLDGFHIRSQKDQYMTIKVVFLAQVKKIPVQDQTFVSFEIDCYHLPLHENLLQSKTLESQTQGLQKASSFHILDWSCLIKDMIGHKTLIRMENADIFTCKRSVESLLFCESNQFYHNLIGFWDGRQKNVYHNDLQA